MTLMERPIVDLMIDSPASLHPSHEVRPKLTRLIKLNHTDWMHQLAADGFIETEIKNLENFVASSLNEVELAEQLAAMLGPVADMDDKAEVDRAVHKWLDLINLAKRGGTGGATGCNAWASRRHGRQGGSRQGSA